MRCVCVCEGCVRGEGGGVRGVSGVCEGCVRGV